MSDLNCLEVNDGGKRKTVRGAAAKMIRWLTEHADFFNAPDVRGAVEFNFAGEGESVSPKIKAAPTG